MLAPTSLPSMLRRVFFGSADGPWTVVVLGNYNPPGATELAAAIARFVVESGTVASGAGTGPRVTRAVAARRR